MDKLSDNIAVLSDNLLTIVTYVIPGLVIYFIRIQTTDGRMPKHSETLLNYFFLSLIFYVFYYPFKVLADYLLINYILSSSTDQIWINLLKHLGLAIRTLFAPVGFGIALARFEKNEPLLNKLLKKFKLRPVHHIPTAWDYRFRSMGKCHVIVTLKDGSIIHGYFGDKSFVSSDPTDRDIYIESVIEAVENTADGSTETNTHRSIYITSGEIKTIEFLTNSSLGDKKTIGFKERQTIWRRTCQFFRKTLKINHWTKAMFLKIS